jgi:hypothetical protein
MKKIKLFITIFLVVALFACSKNTSSNDTLTCNQSSTSDGIKMEQTLELNFKDDNVETLDLTLLAVAEDEEAKQYWSIVTGILESTFNDESTSDGIEFTTKNDSDAYTYEVKMHIDPGKINENDLNPAMLEGLNPQDLTGTKEEARKAAENMGFACS